MDNYNKVGWIDHIVDAETGEVLQQGVPVSETNLGHMDDGIEAVTEAVIELILEFESIRIKLINHGARIRRLEDALFNDITGNPFLVLFDTLDGLLAEGVWNVSLRRIEF